MPEAVIWIGHRAKILGCARSSVSRGGGRPAFSVLSRRCYSSPPAVRRCPSASSRRRASRRARMRARPTRRASRTDSGKMLGGAHMRSIALGALLVLLLGWLPAVVQAQDAEQLRAGKVIELTGKAP